MANYISKTKSPSGEDLGNKLLQSIREMKSGKIARATQGNAGGLPQNHEPVGRNK